VTRRSRALSYGSAVALVLVGGACAALISGATGQILAIGLIGVGLVGLVSLAFLEVGLSEDRDRERSRPPPTGSGGVRRLRPPRLGRRRGQRRRLR
jgi:hypothetical protein